MSKRKFLYFLPICLVSLLLFSSCEKKIPEPDLKAGKITVSEFTLGPGDVVNVFVWRHDELSKKVTVDPGGRISFPLVGEIDATGISVFALRDRIVTGLSKYLVDPQVDVSIESARSQKIYVLGEVQRPGIFALQSPTTVLEAITMAGGFMPEAKPSSVVLIRGGLSSRNAVTLDLKKALKKGDLSANVAIQKGDVIYVPPMLIADLGRKFRYIYDILAPVVLLENGIALEPQVEHVLTGSGKRRGSTIVIGTGQ